MPDVHYVEVQAGRAEPLPDFVMYLQAAERLNCSPWELTEPTGPPKPWWMRATLTLAEAESEAQRRTRKR
jgi:hypothetical protein